MKIITLIRHVENFKEQPDGNITDKGKLQAAEIKEFLQKNSISPELIFTSLFKRTSQTAEISNPNNAKLVSSIAFNEYYTRPDKTDVETVDMGVSRSLTKIYSVYDIYEEIMIVGHSSINKSILQSLLNITYDEAKQLFNSYGEVKVIRYDWKAGDNNWRIFHSFTPEQ